MKKRYSAPFSMEVHVDADNEIEAEKAFIAAVRMLKKLFKAPTPLTAFWFDKVQRGEFEEMR